MNMIQAIKSCLRQYVGFTGRACRSEFWYWILAIYLGRFVLYGLKTLFPVLGGTGLTLSAIFNILIFIPGLAVTVRRLHDIGRTGWWIVGFYIFLFFILVLLAILGMSSFQTEPRETSFAVFILTLMGLMLIYAVILFIFLILDSQVGPNKYGSNPKGEGNFDIFS